MTLEENLHPTTFEQLSVETTTSTDRMTHKLNLSAKYTDLLSRKTREEQIQLNNVEVESVSLDTEVIIFILLLKLVYFKLERS